MESWAATQPVALGLLFRAGFGTSRWKNPALPVCGATAGPSFNRCHGALGTGKAAVRLVTRLTLTWSCGSLSKILMKKA